MADTNSPADKKTYEIMFIVAGDKTDKMVAETTSAVKEEIGSRGGSVTQEDFWGLREFTYPIKRQTTGYYTVMHFDLPTNKVNDLGKHLRLNTSVLRFLMTMVPENYAFRTYEELKAHGKKEERRGRPNHREADRISQEGTTLNARKPRPAVRTVDVTEPAPAAAPVARKSVPVPPPVVEKAVEKKPALPAKSEEERLKDLDKELDRIMKQDEI